MEKDVWVVWALSTLFESSLGSHLVFKAGTALSSVDDRYAVFVHLNAEKSALYRAILPVFVVERARFTLALRPGA